MKPVKTELVFKLSAPEPRKERIIVEAIPVQDNVTEPRIMVFVAGIDGAAVQVVIPAPEAREMAENILRALTT
jgi:hypothetical protein